MIAWTLPTPPSPFFFELLIMYLEYLDLKIIPLVLLGTRHVSGTMVDSMEIYIIRRSLNSCESLIAGIVQVR